jgi:hypothetical protein
LDTETERIVPGGSSLYENCTTFGSEQQKRRPQAAFLLQLAKVLQRGFNLKTPGFEQSLGNIFRIFVTPRPLTQAGGPDELIRRQLKLLGD